MKTIGPMHVGFLERTFEREAEIHWVPSLLMLFDLDRPGVPLPEAELWELVASELPEGAIFDEAILKARGELLVSAVAYPPRPPAIGCRVRVTLGPLEDGASIDKTLYVVGDRHWKGGVASDPTPFDCKVLSWSNAFGGADFADNPIGRGLAPVVEDGVAIHRLPNVEDPNALVRSPRDRPAPAGFDALPMTWPRRRKLGGTYDESTEGLPADLDWTFFNMAPGDQWLEGFFQGDEPIVLENLHPERSRIEARLPGLRGRCFIRRNGSQELEEIALRLDTVHLFPHRLRGVLVFRGVTEVEEDDGDDLELVLCACERLGEPRPRSHYEQALAGRLDPKRGALYSLRQSDLLPEGTSSAFSKGESDEREERLLLGNIQRGAAAELAAARERAQAEGLEVPPTPDPEPQLPIDDDPEELAEQFDAVEAEMDKRMREAEAQMAEIEAQAERRAAELGIDYAAVKADAQASGGGPPSFDARAEHERILARLELCRNAGMPMADLEAQAADPDLCERLLGIQARLEEVYRRHAHWLPAARTRPEDESHALREAIVEALGRGESLAERDFTGADLSGLDLSGADLRGAFLEACDLSDADLSGANLEDAVLVRARLIRTRLVGARLVRTNLGEARLEQADFGEGCVLEGAVLTRAELRGVRLSGARLSGCDFMEATFDEHCVLSGIEAKDTLFWHIDLTGADLSGATLDRSVFAEVKAARANLSRSSLRATLFLSSDLEETRFDDADAENLRVIGPSSADRASFCRARLQKACFCGASFAGADFSDAELSGGTLTKCCFDGARFHRARLIDAILARSSFRGAQLVGVDLRDALLPNASIEGADLSGSQLFRTGLRRVRVSGDTRLGDAEIRFCNFVERKKPRKHHEQG